MIPDFFPSHFFLNMIIVKGAMSKPSLSFHSKILLFFRAIEIDSGNQVFYCNRAAAHSKMNNHYAAVEDCKRAIGMSNFYFKVLKLDSDGPKVS